MAFINFGIVPDQYVQEIFLPLRLSSTYILQRLDYTKEYAIWQWAQTVLGDDFTVIWDKPNNPRPSLPYITLKLSPGRKICNRDVEYIERDTYRYNFKKAITLTVNIFADDNHLKHCENLIDSLEIPNYQTILRQGGLAIWNNSNPIDISELINTDFEGRAEFELILSYNESKIVDITEIDHVSYVGTLGEMTLSDVVSKL